MGTTSFNFIYPINLEYFLPANVGGFSIASNAIGLYPLVSHYEYYPSVSRLDNTFYDVNMLSSYYGVSDYRKILLSKYYSFIKPEGLDSSDIYYSSL